MSAGNGVVQMGVQSSWDCPIAQGASLPQEVPRVRPAHTLPPMKSEFNPLKLDVSAFARAQATLSGEWPLSELERVHAFVPKEVPAEKLQTVRWEVRGDLKEARGGAHEVWLHLSASVTLPMECQRCLRPVDEFVSVDRSVRFVGDEQTAAELDAEMEDDVLVISRSFDLRWWVEDELILDMPLVPRHDVCPEPLPVVIDAVVDPDPLPMDENATDAGKPNPFAALAALKKPKPSGKN